MSSGCFDGVCANDQQPAVPYRELNVMQMHFDDAIDDENSEDDKMGVMSKDGVNVPKK